MPQAKYKQYYQQMKQENQKLFDEFAKLHELYLEDKRKHQDRYNQEGKPVLRLIQDWERRLCRAMGKSTYAVYSQKLSEKFWNLVREDFPEIDMVGVKISFDD